MTCQPFRAVDGSLTDLTFGDFEKTTGREAAVDGFDGFDGFSLEGYAYARARLPLSLAHSLGTERIRQIRQIRQLPPAIMRLAVGVVPSNRRQTAVKWGWSCCRT